MRWDGGESYVRRRLQRCRRTGRRHPDEWEFARGEINAREIANSPIIKAAECFSFVTFIIGESESSSDESFGETIASFALGGERSRAPIGLADSRACGKTDFPSFGCPRSVRFSSEPGRINPSNFSFVGKKTKRRCDAFDADDDAAHTHTHQSWLGRKRRGVERAGGGERERDRH